MGTLDEVMESILDEVEGSLGCAVADMRSGALLGVAHKVSYFTQEYLDAVAAAAVEMFRGQTVQRIEDLLAGQRGIPSEHLVRELQMTTPHTVHFMMVMPNFPDVAVVLIATQDLPLGMGWSAARRSALQIEPILEQMAS